MSPPSKENLLRELEKQYPHLKFFLRKTLDHQDIHLLRMALSKDSRINSDEEKVLFMKGIPMLLLSALGDGVIDPPEMNQLLEIGMPEHILIALRDGKITDDEMDLLQVQIAENLKSPYNGKLVEILLFLDQAANKKNPNIWKNAEITQKMEKK